MLYGSHVPETARFMIRTRSITDNLSYDDLLKQGLIPDLCSVVNQSPNAIASKRYPPFVYKSKDYSFFGMFMDYAIRAGLRINLTQTIDIGTDPIIDVIQQLPDHEMSILLEQLHMYQTSKNVNVVAQSSLTLTSNLYKKSPIPKDDIQKYVPTLVNVIKSIVAKWNLYSSYLDGTIKFNSELSCDTFSGHPDIVTDQCILDIKNTCSFSKISKESCLQVLAYYALSRQTCPSIKYVGFVLPMQRDLVIYNVSNWDSSIYLKFLSDQAVNIIQPNNAQPDNVVMIPVSPDGTFDIAILAEQLATLNMDELSPEQSVILQQIIASTIRTHQDNNPGTKIGTHIPKGKDVALTLHQFATSYPGVPCQLFLGNPRTGKKDIKIHNQIAKATQVVKDTGLIFFTHAVYIINLCANQCDNGDYWQQRYLNEDLMYTAAMGGKGVVVHTGARKHLPVESALYIMEHMVRTALQYATEECPLLLETPCNEGTEVCGKIEELGTFFHRFSDDERKKLGVCVDTVHVWGAGYDPLLYLQHWEKYCNTPIKLVHFNDSRGVCGSCVDRHAPPGKGYIGMEKMYSVAEWCIEKSIPMLRE